jgi:carbonic anhydrase
LIDHWLLAIKDVCDRHSDELNAIADLHERIDRACELNVIQQVQNLCHASIIQKAWHNGQPLAVHGICYGLKDGKVKDLEVTVDGAEKLEAIYRYQ